MAGRTEGRPTQLAQGGRLRGGMGSLISHASATNIAKPPRDHNREGGRNEDVALRAAATHQAHPRPTMQTPSILARPQAAQLGGPVAVGLPTPPGSLGQHAPTAAAPCGTGGCRRQLAHRSRRWWPTHGAAGRGWKLHAGVHDCVCA